MRVFQDRTAENNCVSLTRTHDPKEMNQPERPMNHWVESGFIKIVSGSLSLSEQPHPFSLSLSPPIFLYQCSLSPSLFIPHYLSFSFSFFFLSNSLLSLVCFYASVSSAFSFFSHFPLSLSPLSSLYFSLIPLAFHNCSFPVLSLLASFSFLLSLTLSQ